MRALLPAPLRNCRSLCLLVILMPLVLNPPAARGEPGRYLEVDSFLAETFDPVPATSSAVTLSADLRERIEAILEHPFARLRLRFWNAGETTAWVLDEIGKTEPITVGIVVASGHVERVRILEFRESRGGEVRFPFFTDRFTGAALSPADRLDRAIDGITGATLSVVAVEKLVRIALLLDASIDRSHAASWQ